MSESTLPLHLIRQGKVRELYAVDEDTLLLVASDRVSAFDVVLSEPIPRKGEVLTQMSGFWFRELNHIVPSHFITCDTNEIIARVPALASFRSEVFGRTTLARRAVPVPFECVVRGYLAGSAWKEYRRQGTLAGEPLPQGLVESVELDPPIFSPATKAEEGHDENITFGRMTDELGAVLANRLRDASIGLYRAGRALARQRGIIIADTKFEFGHDSNGELVLIDEVLTPDSSRFWPADQYEAGRGQPSFDKQPLRDYLAGLKSQGKWDGNAPAPSLSPEIVHETSTRYQDAFLRVTGQSLPDLQ
jgi:phosphoribosylaminoimidazole-succinocarboxamide synthase